MGGHLEIKGLNIYGFVYIGAQAGVHMLRICEAMETKNNILHFHIGIWTYSPVKIGNMQPTEALPLADVFGNMALDHGHKPYVIETPRWSPLRHQPRLT